MNMGSLHEFGYRSVPGYGIILLGLCLFFAPQVANAQADRETIQITPDLQVQQLSENVWLHVSWKEMPEWGRVRSNGLIVVTGDHALLIDTAWGENLTDSLLQWIVSILGASVESAILTHAHDDRMIGIGSLKRAGVATYALALTAERAARQSWPEPDSLFTDIRQLHVGTLSVEAFFPGAAHTPDNVVVWLPEQKLLFGGCMIKEAGSRSLGNLADAVVKAWPASIKRLISRYANVETVVPSHGPVGDKQLLSHTLHLCEEHLNRQKN